MKVRELISVLSRSAPDDLVVLSCNGVGYLLCAVSEKSIERTGPWFGKIKQRERTQEDRQDENCVVLWPIER